MNEEKNIWEQLNELPRDEGKEQSSWNLIESKTKNSGKLTWLLSGLVTVFVTFLIVILINISNKELLPIQSTEHSNLQAIYFMRNTSFSDFKLVHSSLYSNVNAINDEYVLANYEKYINHMDPVSPPDPIYSTEKFYDLSFVYKDGSIRSFKLLPLDYFYDIETKQWYFMEYEKIQSLNINHYALYDSILFKGSFWHTILIILIAVGLNISEHIIKRKYNMKKIKFVENNLFAKICYYCLLVLIVAMIFSIVYFKWVIHFAWILLYLITIAVACILVEKKYGSGKPSLYYMIISIIAKETVLFIFILPI